MAIWSGRTSIRGRTCWIAPTTTQSSGFSPLSTTRRPFSCSAPVVTRRYWTLLFRIDHVDVLQSLVRADRPVDHQQRRVRLADRQPNPQKHPRRQQPHPLGQNGIREDAAHRDAARRGVDLVIDEVERPGVRETFFVLQSHQDGVFVGDGRLDLSLR